ncbi:hypothetical protein [Micromonospora globispora]|uniref:hypothetical protein n=1 Tax=Micromonospora globispora TaxID=1450148 RepID=UPI000F5DFFD7|nr:hypothetical protein [Micromonospora globispora]RQW83557.1 hypothetical protein DKL51_31520 [Micromonospora globispora]
MNLEAIAAELATVLGTIAGLRVPPWGVESISPPAAVITLPDRIDYDSTYGRGSDRFPDLAVVVLVGAATQRSSRKALAAYADGSGAKSVKAKLEAHTYTSCDSVRVAWAEFGTPTFAGTDYLAAIFHLDITGKGA